jgi:hypothetical protein
MWTAPAGLGCSDPERGLSSRDGPDNSPHPTAGTDSLEFCGVIGVRRTIDDRPALPARVGAVPHMRRVPAPAGRPANQDTPRAEPVAVGAVPLRPLTDDRTHVRC